MPRLDNQRHERFCQALFQGETADAAYVKTGYSANRGNASRLKAKDSIRTRLIEIKETQPASAVVDKPSERDAATAAS